MKILEILKLVDRHFKFACDDVEGCAFECHNTDCEVCIHYKANMEVRKEIERMEKAGIE